MAAYERPNGQRIGDSANAAIARLDRCFDDLDWRARRAFDPATNSAIRLCASADLARHVNVPDALILENTGELDMLIAE